MKKKVLIFIITAFAFIFSSCDNFFHDLIPGGGNRITSFYLDGQMHSEIGENEIVVTVMPGTSFDSVTPDIKTSPGATLFPITYDYISRSFNDERTFGAAMQIYAGGNMTENVIEMLRGNKSFIRPVMDIPIDFSYPVDFLVVSGQGSVRKYTVRVVIDTGEGKFTSFRFDKFYNPELVRTATGVIDNVNRIVTVTVSYPVENIASYKLIPLFETNNARVYFDNGREIINAQEIFDYLKPPDSNDLSNPMYGTQEKTLTLKRTGYPDCQWNLIVNFEEDPDTSRSIIDFRFTKSKNSSLNADYMAEIINTGNTGTINVTVYYSGAQPPAELRADFVSPAQLPPGTITVNGQNQTSGISYQDFSSPLLYIVTSRSGNLTRTYTVNVSMVSASDPLPQITSFAFDTAKNPLLKSNSSAVIDHNAYLIIIEAAYEGGVVPVNLVPQFTASGDVTVKNITQTSGVSSNNFSSFVFYTVTNPSNPTLKREYKVNVVFVEALSSEAEITAFYFTKADNPELLADVIASINQTTGEITAVLLFETPNGGNRSLIARWSAQGNVYLGNIAQTSGLNSRQFYSPSAYRAVSYDNLRVKNYTVKIKEVNTRIYVRQNATGRNDGTNWQNAYTNLPVACDDAGLFPDEISKELWIAKGTYSPTNRADPEDYLLISPNTSYLGGFAGNETSVLGRTNPNANRATVSGDLGGGKISFLLFSSELIYSEEYGEYIPKRKDGDLSFEYINLMAWNNHNYEKRITGCAIYTGLSYGNIFRISDCSFKGMNSISSIWSSFAIRINPTYEETIHLILENIDMQNCAGTYLQGSNSGSSTLVVKNCVFKEVFNFNIFADGFRNITIENIVLENCHSIFSLIVSPNGSVKITDSNFIYANEELYYGMRSITINCIPSPIFGNSVDVEISNVKINNSKTYNQGGSIYINFARDVLLSRVEINNSSAYGMDVIDGIGDKFLYGHGGAICFNCCDNVTVSESTITNAKALGQEFILPGFSASKSRGYGGGIYWEGTNSLTIINSRFENCTAYTAGGAVYPTTGFTRINTEFINCSP